jgi:SAM-dependent methyltransferase
MRPGWVPSTTIYRRLVDERLHEGGRILDVGCGHTELLRDALARTGRSYGVDLDGVALRKNITIRHTAVATAEALPFIDGAFDLVVMAWVVEHLDRPVIVFREIDRVLAPGGRVLFLTPNAWNYNAWLIRLIPNAFHAFFTRKLYGRDRSDTYPTRYRMNSLGRIEHTLSQLGFGRERVVMNGDPTYVAFNAASFTIASRLERLYDLGPMRLARVHIIAAYRKPY